MAVFGHIKLVSAVDIFSKIYMTKNGHIDKIQFNLLTWKPTEMGLRKNYLALLSHIQFLLQQKFIKLFVYKHYKNANLTLAMCL